MSMKIISRSILAMAVVSPLSAQAVVLDYEAITPSGTYMYSPVVEDGFVTTSKRCSSFASTAACVAVDPRSYTQQYNANLIGADKVPNFLSLNSSLSLKHTAVISPENPDSTMSLNSINLAAYYRGEVNNVIIQGYDADFNVVVSAPIRLDRAAFTTYSFTGWENLSAISITGNNEQSRFSWDDVNVTEVSAPSYTCKGFASPMDKNVSVKKNRALPYKATLSDEGGSAITGINLATPPVISVKYSSSASSDDATAVDALPTGQSSAGNAFTYKDGQWQFNLSTSIYSAKGTYFVEMVSGDMDEYIVDPTCTGAFTVK